MRFSGSKGPKRGSLITLSQVTDLRVCQLYIITLHLFSLLPADRAASDSSEYAGQRRPDLSAALTMSGVLVTGCRFFEPGGLPGPGLPGFGAAVRTGSVLANLLLHYAFDTVMAPTFPAVRLES